MFDGKLSLKEDDRGVKWMEGFEDELSSFVNLIYNRFFDLHLREELVDFYRETSTEKKNTVFVRSSREFAFFRFDEKFKKT
jgi:hypothetical protein